MSGTVYIYNIQAYGTHEDNGDGLGGAHIDRSFLNTVKAYSKHTAVEVVDMHELSPLAHSRSSRKPFKLHGILR